MSNAGLAQVSQAAASISAIEEMTRRRSGLSVIGTAWHPGEVVAPIYSFSAASAEQ
jgi:hypothetical protein